MIDSLADAGIIVDAGVLAGTPLERVRERLGALVVDNGRDAG